MEVVIEAERSIEQVTAAPVARDFEGFYRDHRDRIARALALTLGDTHNGSEATDEAMTRAFQRWRKVSEYHNPEGWVYKVGLNWARSGLRRRNREVLTVFFEGTYEQAMPDPTLDNALAQLSVEQRSVVVCRYLLDWSVEETSAALSVPAGTVKSRLSRALERLESNVNDEI
jgi:RNA polymerase sigma factor (sigma-70 family)